MKYIELPTAKKARIRRALGVSRVTLWSALTFQTQRAGREDSPHGLAGRRARDKRGRCHERLHAELRDRF